MFQTWVEVPDRLTVRVRLMTASLGHRPLRLGLGYRNPAEPFFCAEDDQAVWTQVKEKGWLVGGSEYVAGLVFAPVLDAQDQPMELAAWEGARACASCGYPIGSEEPHVSDCKVDYDAFGRLGNWPITHRHWSCAQG